MSNTRLSLLFASESLTNEGPICTRHTFVYFLKISVNDSMLPVRTVIFSSTKFCEPLPNFNSLQANFFVKHQNWQISQLILQIYFGILFNK